MPRPENLYELIALVRQSRLVDSDRLDAFMTAFPGAENTPNGTARVLSRMTSEGLLTPYQASEISAGRSSSFHLGSYRILDVLGRGGMGQVFLCEHNILGRRAAVKVLSISLQGDPGARRRFAREARAAAALDHPNIVRVYDVEATSDPPFIVMEYVDGMSWQAAVVRHGPFTAAEAAVCGFQAALGLQGIAGGGLIHRDIKPANLLIDRKGGVKILDLGIVRVESEASLTLEGGSKSVLGTLDYLAPEQAVDSSAVDIRADLYALGSTLYFLLTGQPPFPDGEVDEKVGRKLSDDPPRLDEVCKDLPRELADIIHRLLARNPAERFQTPTEAADALLPWAQPVADFPDRLFAPLLFTTATPEPQCTRNLDEPAEATPAMATVEMVRPELKTALRNLPYAGDGANTGGVDFNAPPTNPVRIADSDLCKAEPTGRMTPYPGIASPARSGRWFLGLGAFLIVLVVLTWCFGRSVLGG